MADASESLVVALDASVGAASCAVRLGERTASVRVADARSVEMLERAVRAALDAIDGRASRVDRVLVAGGPGSFIGVRSAVTFANALAYAHGCRVGTVGTLDAVGSTVTRMGDRTLVALPAGRGRLYVAGYRRSPDGRLDDWVPARSVDGVELVALAGELSGPVDVYGAGAVPFAAELDAIAGARTADGVGLFPTASALLYVAGKDPERVTDHAAGDARPQYAP